MTHEECLRYLAEQQRNAFDEVFAKNWGDYFRARAASADTHPQGQDRETGLGS